MGSPENIDSNRLSNERKSIESSIHGSGDVPQKDIWKNVESAPDPTPNNPSVKTITSEASENPHIRDAIAIDIGTSKCNIAACKDKYIQIIEHESSRSVPSYVALSEQGEWLVGKMAENYAVCLQNVIYDIRWLLGKSQEYIKGVHDQKKYFFKQINEERGIATFEMIVPGQENPEFVTAEQVFAKLLETLFTTAYKNLQRPTTIAITVPIKSEENYKKLVSDYAENAMKRIVDAMPSSTTTQDQPEVIIPLDNIPVELIDEPIAVAAAYAPRLNIHPKGDVALVFCMGAGYLQVAAYFIQQKARQEKVSHWTDWVITQISGIESVAVENFAGNDIDKLIFEEMMKKLDKQNGGQRPTLSKRAERRLKIACEKMKCALSFAPHTRIDVDSLYRNGDEDCDLVEVIQKDEIVEYYHAKLCENIEKARGVCKEIKPKFVLLAGGSTRTPLVTERLGSVFNESTICSFLNVDEVAVSGAAAIASKTVTVATESIDYKQIIGTSKEEEKQCNPPPMPTPADNTPILSKRQEGDNQLSKSGQPQPVSPLGNYSFDSQDKRYRNGKSIPDAIDDVQNEEAEALKNIQRNSSSERSHKKDSRNYQSEQQYQSFKTIRPEKSQSPIYLSSDRNVQYLPPSNGYTSHEAERENPTRFQIQEQYGRLLSRNTVKVQHYEGIPYRPYESAQFQSFENNPYNNSQSPIYSYLNNEPNHNPRDQRPILPASTTENREFARRYASSTPLNPMNIGSQHRQNRDNSAISTSSNSRNNSPRNAGQRMHDDQSVNYHEWKRNERGTHFIYLNLNELKCGLNSYLIDPIELRGISVLILIVPSTQNSPYRMASAEFRAAREVQVHLDLKESGNYTCRIKLIGVDIHNYEIIRPLYLPFDGPLDFWRQLSVCLELI